jgi:tRNA-2-methylthio-N6-dimethylallyladenosine synthase
MGRTDTNKSVIVPKTDFSVGQYIDVRIVSATSATLFGEVISAAATQAA